MIYNVALGFFIIGASAVTCTPACTDEKVCLPKENDITVGECQKKPVLEDTPENWTNIINFYRCLHGLSQVKWEPKLVEQAKTYMSVWKTANENTGPSDKLVWPREPSFGNAELPAIQNRGVFPEVSPDLIVNFWYNEVTHFTFSENPSLASLQFAGMVWKSNTHVGCQVDGIYVVCQFHAANGHIPNTRGKFVEQVEEQNLSTKDKCKADSGNAPIGDFEIKTMSAKKGASSANAISIFAAIALLFVVM
eukprot:GEMP01054554.1.p1 GENE.GEMP01054554.1~~GEMP01054554.1.p1  ORF type:complete len:250 (+),score=30.46 GEMP01054554.1:115-864(+)